VKPVAGRFRLVYWWELPVGLLRKRGCCVCVCVGIVCRKERLLVMGVWLLVMMMICRLTMVLLFTFTTTMYFPCSDQICSKLLCSD
jgi:hypothetical protein